MPSYQREVGAGDAIRTRDIYLGKKAVQKRTVTLSVSRLCPCGKPSRTGRTRCNTCRNRSYDNPILRLYRNLKASAKRRRKAFELERDWFVRWIVENGYAASHGRQGHRLHIDRIKNWLGYHPDNVQVLTCSENASKRWHEDVEACPF